MSTPRGVPGSPGERYWRIARRFLRSVVGREQPARAWPGPRGGIFFMMSDRVLLVGPGPEGGWRVTRVPAGGLEFNEVAK